MKIVIAVWFVMIMLAGGVIGFMVANMLVEKTGVKADTEPNNDFDQAELIVPGTYNGSLIGFDTADVYKFNVTGGQTITVKFTSSVAGNYAQQMGLHNQTQSEVLHLSSKNNVTNTGTYNVSSDIGIVYFYIMVNAGPPGQEAKGDYSFQLQIGTAGNETENAALAATWLKELNISPQTDGNFCGMNAYDLQLDGWGTDPEIRGCIKSQGVSGFYSNTTVYNRAMEILNSTYYKKTKWMADGGIGLSRDVTSVFAWNLIQPTKGGGYYFSVSDKAVSSAQSMDANIIGSIMPIAIWDQHDAGNMPNSNTIELYQNGSFFCIGNTTGPIGNLSAYADFIKATVERYDYDGTDDMPGLKYSIKYWEVWNEPESPGGGFGGKTWNYTQLLNATYTAVKSACADAIVVSGGALEVYNLTITQQFWKDVFALGGGNYFDVMNIHYNTERNEQAHTSFTQYNYTIEFFRNLTSSYGMLKPMWITEIGTYTGTPSGYGGYLPYQSEQFQASWMAKHYVYGLEKNVTKFFWDLQVAPGDSVFFTNEGGCQLCYYTHKLMIYELGNFTSVEKLAEGQYKFIVDGKNVYVLWGNGSIPSEITGTVNVTNIFGNITQTCASSIVLSDEPVFVEVLNTSNVSESSHFGYLGNIQGLGVLPPLGGVPWSDALYRPVYPTYFSPFDEVGFKWDRPHPGPFNWNITERTKGVYNWSLPDDYVKQAQQHGVQIIATIWPFVEWDQEYWRSQPGWNATTGWDADLPNSRYKPHNMTAYKNFVQAMVERYDGDGTNDMPGLLYPIKYWETLNEPESCESPASEGFFKGNVTDYLEILNATATAIRTADSDAYIVNGGAGANLNYFWTNILNSGGSQYFDIGNWHYLAQPQEMGDLNAGIWLNLFNPYGITRVWNTEYSIFVGQKPGSDVFITESDQARRFVKGHVQAFAAGAEKIFYIMFSQKDCGLINATNNQTRPSYYAAKTIIQKLDYFTAVSNISDSNKRAYKFTVNGSYVYVLWGSGSVPSEITGNVKVTNILGNVMQTSASSIVLSDEPVFVEEVTAGAENRDPTLWRKDAGIRINGSVPWVMQLPNCTYRMYYTDMGNIYSALSADSLSWTAESGTRLTPGTGTEACIGDSNVIRLPNGTYRMYYQASEDSATHHYIASAWSQDGLSWSREGIRYNSTGTPDNGFAGTPDVIQLPNGSYRMYYVGNGGNATCALFSADTLNWAREGVVLGPIALDPHVIQLHDCTYRMFYTRPEPPDIVGNLRIETAYSADGLIWARESGVKLYPDGVYDSSVLMDPCAIELPNGTYRVYYGGQNETKTQILSAWAKYLPDQTFWMNTALSNAFNLNDYFHDPDSDTISYTAYNSAHISATIADNGSVSFSAVPDWSGKENITFKAADDKGGYTDESVFVEVSSMSNLSLQVNFGVVPNVIMPVDKGIRHRFTVENTGSAYLIVDFYIYYVSIENLTSTGEYGLTIFPQPPVLFLFPGETQWINAVFLYDQYEQLFQKLGLGAHNCTMGFEFIDHNNSANVMTLTQNYTFTLLDGYNISGNFTVQGSVVDQNNQPIYNVEVVLSPGQYGLHTHTPLNGSFSFSIPQYSSRNGWVLTAMKSNYKTVYAFVDVNVSSTYMLKLLPLSVTFPQYELTKKVITDIGFWKGVVSANENYILLLQGMENWANPELKNQSKLMLYTLDGEKVWEYQMGWEAWGADLSSDGKYAVYVTQQPDYMPDNIALLDACNGTLIWKKDLNFTNFPPTLYGCPISKEVQFSHNSSYIGIGMGNGDFYLLDRATGNILWNQFTEGQVRKILFTQNDSFVYVGSGDGRLYKFATSNGTLQWTAHIWSWPYTYGLALSPDESLIAAATKSGEVSVACTSNGTRLWYYDMGIMCVRWVQFSPDGKTVVAGSGAPGGTMLFYATNGTPLWGTYFSGAGMFTNDGNYVFIGDGNGKIYTADGTSIAELDPGFNTSTGYWKVAYVTKDNSKIVLAPRDMAPGGVGIAFFRKVNTPPVAVISSPKNNDVFLTADNIYFDGSNSSDADNDNLTFYWASNISGYLSNQSKFYTTLPAGKHLITLYVNDTLVNISATVNITVNEPADTAPPVITNVQAMPETQEVGGYVNITCAVTDNTGVNVVKVNLTYPNGTTTNITMMKVGTNSYSYNTSYSVLGTYSYYIWTDDISGNQNKSATYQFIITTQAQDTTKPEISNVQANPSTQTQGGAVNITCTVIDNVAVDNVCVDVTGPAGFTPLNTTMTNIAGTNNYYYDSTYSIPGDYSYSIWANDTSNNQNISSAYQFTITVSAVPVPISVKVTVAGREVSITSVGTGTMDVSEVALPHVPPENLHHIGIRINVTITGTLTYANITIKYNESDVINIDESKLRMYYWDETEGKWEQCEKTGVDIISNIVWANVTHLTIFAPMAEKIAEAPPINWLLYIGILTAAIIIVIAVVVIARLRKKQK